MSLQAKRSGFALVDSLYFGIFDSLIIINVKKFLIEKIDLSAKIVILVVVAMLMLKLIDGDSIESDVLVRSGLMVVICLVIIIAMKKSTKKGDTI